MESTTSIPDNSRATYEPLLRNVAYSAFFPTLSQESDELQSSSVTPTGNLWRRALAVMVNKDLFLASPYSLIRTKIDHSAKQTQSKPPFIQLLKSWLEDDEQEQRETWEYLKQALDEDRLSDRKLFP